MPYEPTVWVNALKDGEEVIQKGTPLTADNLNKIENQLEVVTKEADKVPGHGERITAVEDALDPLVGIPQHLNDYQLESAKGQPGGYVPVGADGLIPGAFIPSNLKEMRVVANIAERDALIVFESLRAHVTDATADPTVSSGWAEYLHNGTNWVKVSEKDSIDVVVTWANVTGKPTTFTPAAHTHKESDITDLDKYKKAEVDTLIATRAKAADLSAHELNKANPHGVTTQQVNYLGSYTKKATDTHVDYPMGISVVFVGPSTNQGGWGFYGIVTTYKAYAAGGGTFQTFTPYGEPAENLGGGKYRVRYYQYSVYEWTEWEIFETEEGARKKVADHANNANMHLTPEERELWTNKSSFSGSYTDLTNIPGSFPPSNHTHDYSTLQNTPYIPDKTSDLTNDSNFVQSNAAKLTVATAGSPPTNPSVNDIWIVI